MKKIMIFGLSALMFTLGLSACGTQEEITPDVTPEPDDEKPNEDNNPGGDEEENPPVEEPEETEDYTIITEDNGVSVSQDSFVFAKAQEGDNYPPDARISLTTDSSWNHCTGIYKDQTVLISENKSVIPDETMTLDTVLDSDLHGASGSNEIVGFNIIIDRTKINPGTTKVKLQVRPSNGSSTIGRITTICVNVEVKEFGTIEVDTYTVNLHVDLTGLEEIVEGIEGIESMTLSMSDDADPEEYYGYSADSTKQISIPGDFSLDVAKLDGFKFAKGHVYNAFVAIISEDYSNNLWIPIVADRSSDYSVEVNEDGSMSEVEVFEDNVTIEAGLGEPYSPFGGN